MLTMFDNNIELALCLFVFEGAIHVLCVCVFGQDARDGGALKRRESEPLLHENLFDMFWTISLD